MNVRPATLTFPNDQDQGYLLMLIISVLVMNILIAGSIYCFHDITKHIYT
jgi:hypothetical protein